MGGSMAGKKGGSSDELGKLLHRKITRRDFLRYGAAGAVGLAAALYGYNLFKPKNLSVIFENDAPAELWKWSKEAYYYTAKGDSVHCEICPNQCVLLEGDRSACRTKVHKDGKLYSIAYGNPAAVHIDPIEKKPLFHFLPQTAAFSIATAGCNLRCLNCQNWNISQVKPEDTDNADLMPDAVVQAASEYMCSSIAYTYSEPIAFYEYMYDTAKLARQKGIKNLMITCGHINKKPLEDLAQYLDAANVDLKSFSSKIYENLNAGSVKTVLNTLKTLKEKKVWIEVTNLIVPQWTDDLDMILEMSEWLYKNGFADYPLHFSRFTPMHKLAHLSKTPVSTLEQARNIAIEEGIKYVYIGNVPGNEAESTFCPRCSKTIVGRVGFTVQEFNIENSACKFCGEKIAGVWR